ncbi:hypothetical protein V2J09_000839 [Rumex salicifolius]
MEKGTTENTVCKQAMDSISERLSSMENLYFPRSLQSNPTSASQRKLLLLDLLSRDAPVFLERYGSILTSQELQEFEVLRDDYEINWHLKHLKSLISPSSEQLRSQSMTIKNRRRAYMDKLLCKGNYFSEDEMREREPYLHHEYVGKYQDPSGRGMARPGERWSETLMRQAEEAVLVAKIRTEQQRLGVDEKDWVGNEIVNMEEEEEDDEEEEEEEVSEVSEMEHVENNRNANVSSSSEVSQYDSKGTGGGLPMVPAEDKSLLSAAEMQDQLDQFTSIMQQKFLAGEDHDYLDYSKIDEDETLDDHWLREADDDAEEKYFAED